MLHNLEQTGIFNVYFSGFLYESTYYLFGDDITSSFEHSKSSISIFVIFWMVENSFSTMLELVSLSIPWGEGHNYAVGITPFADLTRSEFRSRYGAPQQTMGRADAHAQTDSQRHPADFGRFSCLLEDNQHHQKASKVLKYQSLTAIHLHGFVEIWAFEIYHFHTWVPVMMELFGWHIPT